MNDGTQSLFMQIEYRLHNQKRSDSLGNDGGTLQKKKKSGYANWSVENLLSTA